jgi:hypothetical protein
MTESQPKILSVECIVAVIVFLLAAGFSTTAQSNATDYRAVSSNEIEVFAAALRSEFVANHWSQQQVICISVAGQDPTKQLVSELRKRQLTVCSQAEWRKRLACSFAVGLQPATFDSSDKARVRIQSVDFREVNTGTVHFVTVLRQGEYALQRTENRWAIIGWAP